MTSDDAIEHVVILVHGICTQAEWQAATQQIGSTAGFKIVLTNYGYFDAFRFLLPVSFYRKSAIDRVWTQIKDTKELYPNARVSFLAHSFGSYIVSEILKREFAFKAHLVVFCGSIVKYDFPFEQISGRFTAPLVNEVGTKDPLPALAESVTWGYGAAGTFGFRTPRVQDRWHVGFGHSDFFTPAFFKEFWQPFFENGTIMPASSEIEKKPHLLWLITVIKLKYMLLVMLAFIAAFCLLRAGEVTYRVAAVDGVGYLNQPIRSISRKLEKPCTKFMPLELMRGKKCVDIVRQDEDVENLVVCQPFTWTGRDPLDALLALSHKYDGCFRVDFESESKISIRIDPAKNTIFRPVDGKNLHLCNCPESAYEILVKRHGVNSN